MLPSLSQGKTILLSVAVLLAVLATVGVVLWNGLIIPFDSPTHANPKNPRPRSQPEPVPEKKGDWQVTHFGRVRYSHHCHERHRLLIEPDGQFPELWDTLQGKRLTVLVEQANPLESSDWSPDKSRFITVEKFQNFNDWFKNNTIVRSIRLWETATGKLLKKIDLDLIAWGAQDSTDGCVNWLTPDTLLLQFFCRKNPARPSVWTILGLVDVQSGKVKMTDRLDICEELTFSPDKQRAFATAPFYVGRYGQGGKGRTYQVGLVDLVDLKLIAQLNHKMSDKDKHGFIARTVWSANGQRIATVGTDHSVCAWDGVTGNLLASMKGHTELVLGVSFSADSRQLVTASDDDTARVWDATTGKLIALLSGHTAGLNDAVFDPDGLFVLTAGEDETARLWEAQTGKQLRVLTGHEASVRYVEFLDGGAQVRTTTEWGIERTWSLPDGVLQSKALPEKTNTDYRNGNCFWRRTRDLSNELWCGPPGAFPPSPKAVPGNDENRVVRVIGDTFLTEDSPEAKWARPRQKMFGHRHGILAMALTVDGKTLVTADYKTVRFWDLDRWDPVTGAGRTTLPQPQEVISLGMTPDGKTLAAGYENGSVIVWDKAATRKRYAIQAHVKRVCVLALSPDGKILATAGVDGPVRYSPDDTRLVSEGEEGPVKVWDVSTSRELARIPGVANALAFTPDGKQLVIAGTQQGWQSPGMVKVWDVATRKERHILLGNSESVLCLAVAPDGKFLVSGSDQSVKLWDLSTLKEQAAFKGHQKKIYAVAISQDRKFLASGSADNSIKFWDIRTGKELASLPTGSTSFLAFTPDGNTLISGGNQLWEVSKVLQTQK